VALQTGFKGKYALDLDAWREYKGHVFSKLPAYAQTRAKELFPEADDHTVLLDPNYEPVLRLLYVLAGAMVILAVYLTSTWFYWGEMVDKLETGAHNAHVPTSQQVEDG
jgi:hypothetical protein